MLDVGIIGVDQEWERYRPVLSKFRRPLRVRVIYDPVRARAERAAERLQARVVTGLQAMAKRSDVQAILLFNADWMGHELLQLLLSQQKPVFVNPWFFAQPESYRTLHEQSAETGLAVMPTLWRRYTPATMRLRELIATDLGSPVSIRAYSDWSKARPSCVECEELVGWLDYCHSLFHAYPNSVTRRTVCSTTLEIAATFGTSDEPRNATLTIRTSPHETVSAKNELSANGSSLASIDAIAERIRNWSLNEHDRHTISKPHSPAAIDVECESGWAKLTSRTNLVWQSGSQAESPPTESRTASEPSHVASQPVDSNSWHDESLTSERQEAQVMLDLFCRRVVGGLIPVADFNDLYQASHLLKQAFRD